MSEPIRLYNITDIARILGISDPAFRHHINKGTIAKPKYLGGSRAVQLWDQEQVEEIRRNYVRVHPLRTKQHDNHPVDNDVEALKLRKLEDGEGDSLDICDRCKTPVFDMTMHIRFAHKGQYSIVGARQ